MTLLEMRTDVRNRLTELSEDFITDVEISAWLNAGQLDTARHLPPDELRDLWDTTMVNCTVGQSKYTLPADCLHIRDIHYDGVPCTLLDAERLAAVEGGNAFWHPSEEAPMAYVWDKITLYPTPATNGKSIAIHYIRLPSMMTADTSNCGLPKQYHEAPILYACSMAHAKDHNWEAFQAFQGLYRANFPQPAQ